MRRLFLNKKWYLFFVLLFLPGCASSDQWLAMKVGGKQLKVELVDRPETRLKGLQGRRSLPEDQGMLFIFPERKQLSFWGKKTFVPLSIAFINNKGKIVQIETIAPESTEPVLSKDSVRYALEVNAGWFKKNNIEIGDSVRVERPK